MKLTPRKKALMLLIAIPLTFALGTATAAIVYSFTASNVVTLTFVTPTPTPTPTATPVTVGCSLTVNGLSGTNTIYETSGTLTFVATLSQPIAGVTVTFMEGSNIQGTATTDSQGVATLVYTGDFVTGPHNYQAIPQASLTMP